MCRVHYAVSDIPHPPHTTGGCHTNWITTINPTNVSVVDGGGETPGPIPNPEAKPARADGTAPGRGWESKLPPTQQLHTTKRTSPTTGALRFFCACPPRSCLSPRVACIRTKLPTTRGSTRIWAPIPWIRRRNGRRPHGP